MNLNLHNLDYLEPVFENKVIGGSVVSTSTFTDSTYTAAAAGTTPGGGVMVAGTAAALAASIGYDTSAYTLTDIFTADGSIVDVAKARANAGAISLGPSGYEASRSKASSLTISNLSRQITIGVGFSASRGT